MHLKNIELGKIGEDIAAVYLQDLGYEILDRNWRFKRVELDIVAHLDSTLVFCEVKTRRSTSHGMPSEAITALKLQNIKTAALHWLGKHNSKHRGLLSNITDSGVVVSEAPPGAKPHKHRFLIRNRLIAALSQSIVVVEAALRSGSLSTSNWAHVLNRQIWGIPGPITSATSAGVHAGIRDNMMKIASSTDDIFQDYKSPDLPLQLGLLDGAIVGLLSQSPRSTHELAIHFGAEIDFLDLQAALTLLEIRKVVALSNQGWKLI